MKIGFLSMDHLRDWTGITRLIDRIAAEMVRRGHSVVIIARDFKASAKIPVSMLDYPHELIRIDINSPKAREESREKISASDIQVCAVSIGDSSLPQVSAIFKGSVIPYVLGEPFDPRVLIYQRGNPYVHFGALYSADAVQVLLSRYLPYYPEVLRRRAFVIGNPVHPPSDVDFKARREKTIRTIVSVGRFNEDDKRFSLLIRAFALLYKDFPDWRLKLVGDGQFWEYYHIMAEQLGIKKVVIFTGGVPDPDKHYADSDIFCLPSRAEGFPMVLTEAAAHALPLAGYRTCMALDVLIEPDMGVLAEAEPISETEESDTPQALADKLRSLMELSPEEREKIGKRVQEKLQSDHGESIVFDKWEELLSDVCKKVSTTGKTALERISEDFTMNGINSIPPEWDGLTPDSPVWTDETLSAAARFLNKPEGSEESGVNEQDASESELLRLRCEIAGLKRDYATLEKKYASLLGQFQAAAGRRRK
ncbi:MAG: glycosyltransferase [Oscillospiraceae bacterium]|nr:glycosyltransferase [Oscillospiraceae bacterium]